MPIFNLNDPNSKAKHEKWLARQRWWNWRLQSIFGHGTETMVAVAFVFAGGITTGMGIVAGVRDDDFNHFLGGAIFGMILGGVGLFMLPKQRD